MFGTRKLCRSPLTHSYRYVHGHIFDLIYLLFGMNTKKSWNTYLQDDTNKVHCGTEIFYTLLKLGPFSKALFTAL